MKFLRLKYICVFITILAIAVPTLAQNNEVLDTVHVTAEPAPEISAYDFIGSHSQINLSPYKNEFIQLGDILTEQSGIDIQSLSGVGQYTTPRIRGAEGQQVLVFENGVPVNDLNGSGANIGSISLNNIETINIYRGFVPMELSATAIGGAIDIQSNTKKNKEGHSRFHLGSYGVYQLSLNQNYLYDDISGNIQLEQSSADNNFIYKEQQPVSSPSTPKNEERHNNGTKNENIGTSFEYKIKPDQILSIKTNYKNNKRHIAGKINSQNNKTNISSTENTVITSYKNNGFTGTYTYKNGTEIYDDREGKIGLGEQHNQYDSNFHKINATYSKNLRTSIATINQQIQQETVNSYYLNIPNSSNENCLEIEKCDNEFKRTQLNTGLRIQSELTSNMNSNIQIVKSWVEDKSINNSNNSNHFSFFSGLSYNPIQQLIASINISKQIRIPNTNEMFGDRGTTLGNPELKPEKSLSTEIGFENYNQNSHFSFYIFHREVDDNISAEQDNRGVIKFSNIAQTRFQGAEFGFDISFNPYISYLGNVTYKKGIITDNNLESTINNEVSGHRTLSANHSLLFAFNTWNAKITNRYESGGYYTNQNDLSIPTNTQFDFSIGKQINLTNFTFKIINITDQRVRDFPISPVSGTTYYLTINQKWDLQ